MTVRYFCDRCDKERDFWDIEINIRGKKFKQSLCQECIDELVELLRGFFGTEVAYIKTKGIY